MKNISKQSIVLTSLLGITTLLYIQFRRRRTSNNNNALNHDHSNNDENEDDDEKNEIEIRLLTPKFEQACKLAQTSIFQNLPTNDQLMLYGLYKQALLGNASSSSSSNKKPSMLDMVASAKYNAWTKFHDMPRDFAMLKYIEVVNHFQSQLMSESSSSTSEERGNDVSQSKSIANASLFVGTMDNNDDIVYDDDDGDDDVDGIDNDVINDDFLSVDEDEDDEAKQDKSFTSFSFGAQQSTLSSASDEELLSFNSSSLNANDSKHALFHAAMIGNVTLLQQCLDNHKTATFNDNTTSNTTTSMNVDECDEDGQTALHLAADKGHVDCVNLLLQNGANPNAADTSGISALEAAVIGGNVDVVRILLDAGGDPDQKDIDGETPRTCAEDDDDEEMKILLRNALRL